MTPFKNFKSIEYGRYGYTCARYPRVRNLLPGRLFENANMACSPNRLLSCSPIACKSFFDALLWLSVTGIQDY